MDGQETLVGSTLKDKWRLDALIGRGGMAAVYAATHRNGSRVAVKVLHPEFSRNAGVRERFVREGYLANRVGRGAVAALDDDVADDGSAFLVMELLDGETLEDLRERQVGGRLPAAIVVSMVDQVLATLVVAHEQGIVHRDLKPENIFLTRSGEVKLLDFGIARIHEGQEASRATATGAMMGTPSYLPPEQARGRWAEVDARSDVWAVGATMFTLLTGRCVHEGETVPELLLQAMTEAAPTLASVDVDVDAGLASVVDRALSFKKEDRWPDVASMREAFRGLDLPDLHLPPVEPPSTPRVSVSQRDSSAVRGRTTGPRYGSRTRRGAASAAPADRRDDVVEDPGSGARAGSGASASRPELHRVRGGGVSPDRRLDPLVARHPGARGRRARRRRRLGPASWVEPPGVRAGAGHVGAARRRAAGPGRGGFPRRDARDVPSRRRLRSRTCRTSSRPRSRRRRPEHPPAPRRRGPGLRPWTCSRRGSERGRGHRRGCGGRLDPYADLPRQRPQGG